MTPPPSKPFFWTGDFPEAPAALKELLEQTLSCPVVSRGKSIPARWTAFRRQLGYLGRGLDLLRNRRKFCGCFSSQQFNGLYGCFLSSVFRLPLPPIFPCPVTYIPRRGLFGFLWHRFYSIALNNPALKIAFCYSRGDIEPYRQFFPTAAHKFRHAHKAIIPIPPPAVPPREPYLFSSGFSFRDYATLFAAARRLPPGLPPIRIACKPANVKDLTSPPNVVVYHDLWGAACNEALAGATLVLIILQPPPATAGETLFLQAMSAARPIIATRTPVSEDFLDDTCAWLVPPQDPAALAAAIQAALANPEKTRQKGAAAQARFQAIHSKSTLQQCVSAVAEQLQA